MLNENRYKECRDCHAEIGDKDLYLKGRWLYCLSDYMLRFGTSPADTAREN